MDTSCLCLAYALCFEFARDVPILETGMLECNIVLVAIFYHFLHMPQGMDEYDDDFRRPTRFGWMESGVF